MNFTYILNVTLQNYSWRTHNYGLVRHSGLLVLSGPRLFGLENEPPDDLFNIFYRCARYCIFSGRKRTTVPSVKFFVALVRDELKLKYAGNRILKYRDNQTEKQAIDWLRVHMGWCTRVGSEIPIMNNQILPT